MRAARSCQIDRQRIKYLQSLSGYSYAFRSSLIGFFSSSNHGWKADIGITTSCINLPKICPIVHPVYILQKSIMERSDSAHLQYRFVANSIASLSLDRKLGGLEVIFPNLILGNTSINRMVPYHKCSYLIGYATRCLFRER